MSTRHAQIAEELRRAIDRNDFPVGSQLPSEAELAARYRVARGTVRQAVAALTTEGLVGSRQGARRIVLAGSRSQSFSQLRSFAQWAHAMGRTASGSVVATQRRPATAEDAARLHLRSGADVLSVLRVRGLDGEAVLLERTVYADWIAGQVERIEPDCVSVTQRLFQECGLVFAHGEHLIDAVAATVQDAALLGIRRTSPLLRIRRVTTTPTGRPIEWSDDRYRPDAVNFSMHNSVNANSLARHPAQADTNRHNR